MASFGAKNPYFAPIESEPEGTLPVYKGEPVKIGRLVKADLALTMASGKLYADDELAESAVVLGARAWVKNEEFWTTKWRMLETIKLTLDEHGIEIPYPQLTVHMHE